MRGTKVQKANKRAKPQHARNLYQAEARIEELESGYSNLLGQIDQGHCAHELLPSPTMQEAMAEARRLLGMK